MDAQIQEYIIHPDSEESIHSLETIEDMEKSANRFIESHLSSTVEVLQKEHNADALGLLEYLSKFHPKIYKEIEEDWDNIFPHIDIDVNVEVIIRRRGLSS